MFSAGIISGLFLSYKFVFLVCKNKDRRITMFSEYFYTLDKWIRLNRKQYVLDDFLIQKNYKNIAIYGLGKMGNQLVEELQGGESRIVYAIDQNYEGKSFDFPVKTVEDDLETTDIVVITPSYDFFQIKEKLENKVSCPIVSLYQLVEEWYEQSSKDEKL